jgi:serine/threonine-protein kinase
VTVVLATTALGKSLGDWEPGDVVEGKYQIERRLGAGAMGIVYLARHLQLDTRVALKVLRAELALDGSNAERLLAEARAAASLRHPNVVRVLDLGRLPSKLPFIVLEYLDGENLEQRLVRDGPLSVSDSLLLVAQACDAIAEAHAAGIIHRDLKPENLFLVHQADGSPLLKVCDFGVSKRLGPANLRTTAPSETLGTPLYMSPEQLGAGELDARSDIWSLGVVLTELCTGRAPFEADSVPELFDAICQGAPRLPSQLCHGALAPHSSSVDQTSSPPEHFALLDEIVKRCLEREPSARFASVTALADALRAAARQLAARTTSRLSGWTEQRGRPAPSSGTCDVRATNSPKPHTRRRLAALGSSFCVLCVGLVFVWWAQPDAAQTDSVGKTTAGTITPVLHPTPSSALARAGYQAPASRSRLAPWTHHSPRAAPNAPLAVLVASKLAPPAETKALPRPGATKGDRAVSAAIAERDPASAWDVSGFGGRR